MEDPKTTETEQGSGAAATAAAASVPAQRAVIKNVDMSEEMQQASVDIANEALQKLQVEKDIAAFVKKALDAKFGPTWHVVVGKNFGSYVTHGESRSAADASWYLLCLWRPARARAHSPIALPDPTGTETRHFIYFCEQ